MGIMFVRLLAPWSSLEKKLDLRSDQQTDWSFLKQRNGL